MKNELIKLADHLDRKGLHAEANYLDALIRNSEALSKRASEPIPSIKDLSAGTFDHNDRDILQNIEGKLDGFVFSSLQAIKRKLNISDM